MSKNNVVSTVVFALLIGFAVYSYFISNPVISNEISHGTSEFVQSGSGGWTVMKGGGLSGMPHRRLQCMCGCGCCGLGQCQHCCALLLNKNGTAV